MENKPAIFSVMANYNGYDFTITAVNSLRQVDYDNHTIIVVDDCSMDDSYEKLSEIEDIVLLRTKKNSGLNTAFNVGIKYALQHGADYVFLVQNDTDEFSKDIFNNAIHIFNSDPTVGLVGPNVVDSHKNPRWLDDGKYVFFTHINTSEGYIIRRDVFEKIGLFNEGLVVYFEDLDFIIRMRKAGFRTAKDKNSQFLHVGQATFSKQKFKPDYLRIRNIFMMMRRYCKDRTFYEKTKEVWRLLKRHFKKVWIFISRFQIKDAFIEILALILGIIVGIIKPWDKSNELN